MTDKPSYDIEHRMFDAIVDKYLSFVGLELSQHETPIQRLCLKTGLAVIDDGRIVNQRWEVV